MISNGNEEYKEKIKRFECLLLQRDKFLREAQAIKIAYMKEFGDILVENFQTKIECIRKKKILAYCQKQINCGRNINIQEIESNVEEEMISYKTELEELSTIRNEAQTAQSASSDDLERAKKLYRDIAKRIHPDVFEGITENEELYNLWQRAVDAYHELNPEKLIEIDFQIDCVLKKMNKPVDMRKFDDIDERIERIEYEISRIVNSTPYNYEVFLKNKKTIKDKRAEIKNETYEYQQYLDELSEKISSLLEGKVISYIWKMK